MIDGTKLPYANTTVPVEKTREDINDLLKKFGARGIQWTWLDNKNILRFLHEFEYEGVKHGIAYELTIPEMGTKTGRGYDQQFVRNDKQAYRLLFYVIKAKLTAVETGLETFENEFLSKIMYQLPNGSVQNVGDIILDQISKTKSINLLGD
jgi:hypothetical protein